jgi:hypothetical protein
MHHHHHNNDHVYRRVVPHSINNCGSRYHHHGEMLFGTNHRCPNAVRIMAIVPTTTPLLQIILQLYHNHNHHKQALVVAYHWAKSHRYRVHRRRGKHNSCYRSWPPRLPPPPPHQQPPSFGLETRRHTWYGPHNDCKICYGHDGRRHRYRIESPRCCNASIVPWRPRPTNCCIVCKNSKRRFWYPTTTTTTTTTMKTHRPRFCW